MCIEYNHGIDTTNTTKSNMYKPGTVMNIIPCIIKCNITILNKFYSLYMAAVVGIISRRGLRSEGHHIDQPNESKLALYNLLLSH